MALVAWSMSDSLLVLEELKLRNWTTIVTNTMRKQICTLLKTEYMLKVFFSITLICPKLLSLSVVNVCIYETVNPQSFVFSVILVMKGI